MTPVLLDARGMSKTFPGLKALDDVSLTVGAGEIVALLGQNGSGKSTLVKIIAGVHDADPGAEIALADGAEMHFIHQDLGLIESLSTVENLDLERRLGRSALLPAPLRRERRRAERLITGFGADFDVRLPIRDLTAAERAVVAIARAMDGWRQPGNVLVLDEPTAALHGDEVDTLFRAVREVAQRGAGVVFITHRLDEVAQLADRVVALRDGRVIADAAARDCDHDTLVRMVAGAIATPIERRSPARASEPILSVRGLRGPTIRSLDLAVEAGEILGVSGVLGSGREQVAATLFGVGDGSVDALEVGGADVPNPTPRRAIRAGMAFVPGDRHRHGGVMTMTARENLTLPQLNTLRRRFGRLDRGAELEETDRWFADVDVRPNDPTRPLALFSGGNQQKVILAKWLRTEPRVLLLDEPTQGVDVGAKAGIFTLVNRAAERGAGVLVCSSDDKELASTCDRVLVLRDGEQVAELRGAELTEAQLIRSGHGR